jgi:hypothetical protein
VARVGALLDQVAPVHVDAHAAAVELGDAQVDQFDQARTQAALLVYHGEIDHGLEVGLRDVEQVDTCRHDASFQGGRDAKCVPYA